ncbi:phosphoribosylformylglycinamidine cyclo-ligase [bacterium]|nr:phosphoribosylformylglycinamidine cyclo-ligase [bacterium]RQV97948.1 MAG: phosphoribosylformylglycinamidine cyclo-ligase [bacterium]
MTQSFDYKSAGVDIEAGENAVKNIKAAVRSTFTSGVLTDIGKFGGFFALDLSKYKNPVLVSSIDGVGTKLKVAFMMKRHDTVGEDLVNHCINDILVGGACPLFFLDYIGTGILRSKDVESLVSGMVRGCKAAECALIGGEMAEMPGFYQAGEYDVAGCIVGIVEKDHVIDGSRIQKNDVLIGLPSTGLHTNGYSLARKVLFDHAGYDVNTRVPGLECSVGEALIAVHRCYKPVFEALYGSIDIHGMSHITGGGIEGNTRRILPDGLSLSIQWESWKLPSIFRLIQEEGHVPEQDMHRTFNMGVGYIFIVPPDEESRCMEILEMQGETPIRVGEVV